MTFLVTAKLEFYVHVDGVNTPEEAEAKAKQIKVWNQTMNSPFHDFKVEKVEESSDKG